MTIWKTVAYSSTLSRSGTVTFRGPANAVQIVAHEIDNHEILGFLLGDVQNLLRLSERGHGGRLAHCALHRAHAAETVSVC